MRFTKPALLSLLCCLAAAAQAESTRYECRFTQECMGSGGCSDTDYTLAFTNSWSGGPQDPLATPGSSAEIVTPYATLTGLPLGSADGSSAGVVAAQPNGNRHLISVTDDAAWYSVHMPQSELALFYAGTCEATQQ